MKNRRSNRSKSRRADRRAGHQIINQGLPATEKLPYHQAIVILRRRCNAGRSRAGTRREEGRRVRPKPRQSLARGIASGLLRRRAPVGDGRRRLATLLGWSTTNSVGRRAAGENVKKVRKPKPWKHSEPITRAQLIRMREEFWDTAPHYGGRKEIWDALQAAADAELDLAQAIVDSAGIIVQAPDLTICYDERGAKYELPKYVLSEPTNLIHDS